MCRPWINKNEFLTGLVDVFGEAAMWLLTQHIMVHSSFCVSMALEMSLQETVQIQTLSSFITCSIVTTLIRCTTINVSEKTCLWKHSHTVLSLTRCTTIAGIGTYTGDGSSVNQSWWGKTKSSFASTIDEGIATTFDSHVIAGYRFLMRYYGRGDPIYIFGFSRGAFTARFLARMVSQVGLLSMGNEEMVPFAYRTYQNYELGLPTDQEAEERKAYIDSFKSTFCRHEHSEGEEHSEDEAGIKVHFLGLFDTVNSVGTLEVPFKTKVPPPKVHGTAEHVRHAVAIDERRVKFKAALLQQDLDKMESVEDIKEVWFPGNHGDIGGGWPADTPKTIKQRKTFWGRLKAGWRTWRMGRPTTNKEDDVFQLSDIALKWMMDELDHLPGNTNGKGDRLEWHAKEKDSFMRRFYRQRPQAIQSPLHDTMVFAGGSSLGKVIFWNFMGMS